MKFVKGEAPFLAVTGSLEAIELVGGPRDIRAKRGELVTVAAPSKKIL